MENSKEMKVKKSFKEKLKEALGGFQKWLDKAKNQCQKGEAEEHNVEYSQLLIIAFQLLNGPPPTATAAGSNAAAGSAAAYPGCCPVSGPV